MNAKQLAEKLNGREYGSEITPLEAKEARESGLVVVFGSSDDQMEFEGAIYDEFGCYNGGTAYLNKAGLFYSECEDEGCPYAAREKELCKKIEAILDDGWSYKTEIPHSTFEIKEGNNVYCTGIVFSLHSLGL